MAVNCCVIPASIAGEFGEMFTACRWREVTINVAVLLESNPLTGSLALMFVDIGAHPVASPSLPLTLLMSATDGLLELHVTAVVRSLMERSVKVPVAVYCWVVFMAMVWLAGAIIKDLSAAGVTVIVVLPVIAPESAVMMALPIPTDVAKP